MANISPKQKQRAYKLVQGLIISWTDPEPLTTHQRLANESISHKNAIKKLYAQQMWRKFGKWMVEEPALLWRVEFTVVFRYPNGVEQLEHRCVVHRAALQDISEACMPDIQAALKFGNNPLETRFVVECLGNRPPRESDYKDYEAAA